MVDRNEYKGESYGYQESDDNGKGVWKDVSIYVTSIDVRMGFIWGYSWDDYIT